MFQVNTLGRLILFCIFSLLVVSSCSSSKHAAVMSGETLAEPTSSEGEASSTLGEGEGIPLSRGSLSQGSIGGGPRGTESFPEPEILPGDGQAMTSMEPEAEMAPASVTQDLGADLEGGDSSLTFSDSAGTFGGGAPSSGAPGAGEFSSESAMDYVPGLPSQPSEGGDVGTFDPGASGYEGEQFARALSPSDFVPEGPTQPGLGNGDEIAAPSADIGGEEVVKLPPSRDHGIEPLGKVPQDSGRGMETTLPGLSHVFFDFDRYEIRDDAAEILVANAQLLNSTYQDSQITVQGHCDERGTNEYNLVLGDRRAQAVKNYLGDLGVERERIHVVSYGEERPFCSESISWCWQQNRRGHFVLQ
jgi:peptidoglycan-associated lipoprotein